MRSVRKKDRGSGRECGNASSSNSQGKSNSARSGQDGENGPARKAIVCAKKGGEKADRDGHLGGGEGGEGAEQGEGKE
eukprot:3726641-Pleurochrysis_carterae.AAC.2